MKKLFFASLWVLACLVVACSDEKDEPNDAPGSIIGEWVFPVSYTHLTLPTN